MTSVGLLVAALVAVALATSRGAADAAEGCAGFSGQLELVGEGTPVVRPAGLQVLVHTDLADGSFSTQTFWTQDGGTFCASIDAGTHTFEFQTRDQHGRFRVMDDVTVDQAISNVGGVSVQGDLEVRPEDINGLTVPFRFLPDGSAVVGQERTPWKVTNEDFTDAASIFHRVDQYLDWWDSTLPATPIVGNVVDISITDQLAGAENDRSSYKVGRNFIKLDTHDSDFTSRRDAVRAPTSAPENAEWHELTHYFWDLDGHYADEPPGSNHGGWQNDQTWDSFSEGWASFVPAAAARSGAIEDVLADEAYAGFGSLEHARWYAWSHKGTHYREDFAVAAVLWDLWDAAADTTLVPMRATPGDPGSLFSTSLTDEVSISLDTLYDAISTIPDADDGTGTITRDRSFAGFHDELFRRVDIPAEWKDDTVDLDGDGVGDVAPLDVPFLVHGFHTCDIDGDNPECYYELTGPIGRTDHVQDGNGGLEQRFKPPSVPGAEIVLSNPAEVAAELAMTHLHDGVPVITEVVLGAGEELTLPIDLPPYDRTPVADGEDPPPCSAANDALIGVSIVDQAVGGGALGGLANFDTCELDTLIGDSEGQPAMRFSVGDASLRYRVELVDAATAAGDPSVLVAGPELTLEDVQAAVGAIDATVPAGRTIAIDGVLRLHVPPLGDLGARSMPGSVIELNASPTAAADLDLPAYAARLTGQIVVDGVVLDLSVVLDFVDPTTAGLEAASFDLDIARLAGNSLVSAADAADLLASLVGGGWTVPADLVPDLALRSLGASGRFDGTGIDFVDLEAVGTIRDVRAGVLFSVDVPDVGDPRLLLGATFDDATDPAATSFRLESLLDRSVGSIGSSLELPAFSLVSAHPAPGEGETPLTFDGLRPEQQAFFGTRSLPAELDIAGTLGLAAQIDLDAVHDSGPDAGREIFGGAKDLFGIPDGQAVDLTGQLGFSLRDVAAGGPSLDALHLRVGLPVSGPGPAGVFPSWLSFPDGAAVTLDYDAAPPESLTLGVEAPVRIGLHGGDVGAVLRGALTTVDGELQTTLDAVLTEDWTEPFGQSWLRVLSDDATGVSLVVSTDSLGELDLVASLAGSAIFGPDVATDATDPLAALSVSASIGLDGTEPEIHASLELVDLADVVSGSSMSAVLEAMSGGAIAVPADLTPDISLSSLALELNVDEFGSWADVVATGTIRDVLLRFLFSVDDPAAGSPRLLLGATFDDALDPTSDTINLDSFFSGALGDFSGYLEVPAFSLATVLPEPPETDPLTFADLRPEQQDFFGDRGLPDGLSLTGSLTLASQIDLDATDDTGAPLFGDVKEMLGIADGQTLDLTGRLAFTLGDLTTSGFSADSLGLRADLPALGMTGSGLFPEWLQFPSGVAFTVDMDTTVPQVVLGVEAPIDVELYGGDIAAVLTGRLSLDGDRLSTSLEATLAQDWTDPFGQDWLRVLAGPGTALRFSVSVDTDTGALELLASLDASVLVGPGVSVDPANKVLEASLHAEIGLTGDRPHASLRVDLDDVAVLTALEALGIDTSGLGPLGSLVDANLSGSALAAVGPSASGTGTRVDFAVSGEVTFTDIVGELDLAAGLLFSTTIDEGTGGGITVGVRLQGPGGAPVMLTDLLGDLPFDVELPPFGFLFSTRELRGGNELLNDVELEFVMPLFGCEPQPDPDDNRTECDHLRLDAGPNSLIFLSNIALPDPDTPLPPPTADNPDPQPEPGVQLAKGLQQFGIDTGDGVQLSGTLSIFDPAGLSVDLTISLPRVINDGSLPDWVQEAGLSVKLSAELSSDPSVSVALTGDVHVRLRQTDTPNLTAGECAELFGELLPGYDADGLVASQYCYQVVPLSASIKVEIGTGGLTLAGTLELGSDEPGSGEPPYVWERPFGIEWLAISNLTLMPSITLPPSGTPEITLGASGSLRIGEKDLFGSIALGVRVIQGTPFVLPNFEGIRLRSDNGIDLNDLYLVYKIIAETSGQAGLPQHITDLGIPNPALRNLDFGFALASRPELCLEPGLIVAADFYLDDQFTSPTAGAGGCQPIGPPPDDPCSERGDGCFAGMFFSVSANGIFAQGSLSPIDFGPVHWEGGLVDLAVSLLEQRFVLSGGVSVDGLGSGELSALVQGLPAPEIDFFGDLVVAGGFEAQVSGHASLGFTTDDAGNPVFFPPTLAGEISFEASMRNDLEQRIRDDLAAQLLTVGDAVRDAEDTFTAFVADPLGALVEAVAALEAAGIDVPDWAEQLVAELDGIDEEDWPTLSEILEGEPIELSYPAVPTCPPGEWYNPFFNSCSEGSTPTLTCPLGGTLDGGWCTLTIDFGFMAGLSKTLMIAEIEIAYEQLVQGIEGLPDNVFGSSGLDLRLSDVFAALADTLQGPSFLSVECVSFSLAVGASTAESPTARVSASIAFTVAGLPEDDQPYVLGFTLDLTAIDVSALGGDIVTGLLGGFGPADDACRDETAPPEWAQAVMDVPQSVLIHTSPSTVAEGSELELTGTFMRTPTAPEAVTIEWGDGSSETVTTSSASFTRTHVYADDDPSGTASDTEPITVAVAGGETTTAEVRVVNIAPTVSVTGPAAVDEGTPLTLALTVEDPGTDELTVDIDWGDGTTETVELTAGGASPSHTYADDDPTGTSRDPRDVVVTAADDDLGETVVVHDVLVRNVVPVVTAASVAAIEATTIHEDIPATFTIEWDDPGADDHVVVVQWGDGSADSWFVPAASPDSLTASHTWLDDDPAGTSSDPYDIRIIVLDDDRGIGTDVATATVRNVAPVVMGPADPPEPVQYSDPLADVVITATDVAGDPLVAAVSWSVDGGPSSAGLPGSWNLTAGPCDVSSVDNTRSCTWTIGGTTDFGPGTYTLSVTVSDGDLGSTAIDIPVVVLPEDARAYYHGPVYAATTDARDDTAVIELRATIQDITLAIGDPAWDPYPGDILDATVRFVDRERSDATLCEATLGYTFPDEIGLATATCDWEADIGSADADTYVVGIVVEGWYTRDQTDDDTVVTVARPLDDFITGGGFVELEDSEGTYAGDPGSHSNFGFSVKFNKKGTNLQGRAVAIVRRDGRVYQIKSNALSSLGVVSSDGTTGVAEFESKATLIDVTDEDAPISIGGNLTFQMRLTDRGEPGDHDTIGLTLWDKDGTLLYSSRWESVQTVEQLLAGGNLSVKAGG